MTASATPLYLVDASIYIFRAWFSIPDSLRGQDGQAVNAAYGFTRFLTELLEKAAPERIVFAFDESLTHSFRNELYPPYKMNRELPPEELKKQFDLCKRLVTAAGIALVAHDRYEADDLIGTLAIAARQRKEDCVIVSADKDLAQLLTQNDQLWDFARNLRYSPPQIVEKFGVETHQIADYLGLCGDAVDNIPGVPGVGAKTAAALLQAFGCVDGVYERLPEIATLSFRGAKTMADKLAPYKEQALLSRELATIVTDAPIDCSVEFTHRQHAEVSALRLLAQEMGDRGAGLFERIARNSNAAQLA